MHGAYLDHKIKYKKSIPHKLKRRINRLSALFEIADDEFLRIKKEITLEESIIIAKESKREPLLTKKPPWMFSGSYLSP
jgi:putative GTP pyrophosphokinase